MRVALYPGPMTLPTKTLHSRLPLDLHQEVVDYAAATHRKLTGAVIQLLEVGLRAEAERDRRPLTPEGDA